MNSWVRHCPPPTVLSTRSGLAGPEAAGKALAQGAPGMRMGYTARVVPFGQGVDRMQEGRHLGPGPEVGCARCSSDKAGESRTEKNTRFACRSARIETAAGTDKVGFAG